MTSRYRGVRDTRLYDLLNVTPDVGRVELKRAYRSAAIQHHPDKNRNDPTAVKKFQEVSKAYEVLSDTEKRRLYDERGLQAVDYDAQSGSDPFDFFAYVFGGSSFSSWVGEFSGIRNFQRVAEIKRQTQDPPDRERDLREEHYTQKAVARRTSTSAPPDYIEQSHPATNEDRVPGSQRRRADRNKGPAPLTEAQKRQLSEFETQRRREIKIRVENVVQVICRKLRPVTREDASDLEWSRFESRIRQEAELMKLDSFGLDFLHEIGNVLTDRTKAFNDVFNTYVPLVGRLREWYYNSKEQVRDFGAVHRQAMETQTALEEMEDAEDAAYLAGLEWDQREQIFHQNKVTGRILSIFYQTSIREIHDILGKTCSAIFKDPHVPWEVRKRRADALSVVGAIFQETRRDPREHIKHQMFEKLVAEAMVK